MQGYPQQPQQYGAPPPQGGYNAGPPPPGGFGQPPAANYGGAPPPAANYGGAPPPAANYGGAPPPAANYGGAPPPAANYGGAPPPAANYGGAPPPAANYGGAPPLAANYGGAPPPATYGGPPLPQQQQPSQMSYSGVPGQPPAGASQPPPQMYAPPQTAPAARPPTNVMMPGMTTGGVQPQQQQQQPAGPPQQQPAPNAGPPPPGGMIPGMTTGQPATSGPPPPGAYNTNAPPPTGYAGAPPGQYGSSNPAGGPPPPGGYGQPPQQQAAAATNAPYGAPPAAAGGAPPPSSFGGPPMPGSSGPPPPSSRAIPSGPMPPPVSGPGAPAPPMFLNPQSVAPRAGHGGVHGSVPVASGGGSTIGQQMANMSMGEPVRPPSVWDPNGLEPLAERFPLQSEEGQCRPQYMRLTVNAFPNSAALAQRFGFPFGIVIHPMADTDPVPVVNFGAAGIIRCRRCRAYINSFTPFLDAGRRWRCNVCDLVNDLPAEYFCNLDANNRRKDIDERPELKYGTVEFEASAENMARAPQPPVFLFVLDVSQRAVQSGMLRVAADTIRSALNDMGGDPRTQIGFITFDSNFTFYNLRSGLSQPQALVVSDLENPFLPLPTDLLVNLAESRSLVDDFLSKLPSLFQDTDIIESCLGPALQAAYMLMMHIGGKMLVFQTNLPSIGKGGLQPREDVKLLGTEKEAVLLQPATDFYKTIALDCSKHQICIDLFTFPQQYIDLASLCPLAKYTGGQLYYYPSFDAIRDGDVFAYDLSRTLTRTTCFEAVMRVRCTKGVKVHAFHGNYFLRGTDLLALPNIDPDKGFACEISHEEQTMTTSHVIMQCALLYTTSRGERRIRVHTLNVPVVSEIRDLYNAVDCEAMSTILAKSAVDLGISVKLAEARARLQDRFVQGLRSYRAMMQTVALPKQLELMPLFVLAMLKNAVLRDGVDIRTDERTALAMAVGSFTLPQTISFFLPSLFSLHTLTANGANYGGVNGNQVIMPPRHPLSLEHLSMDGIYLIENGLVMMLWIGKNCPPQLLEQLLNVNNADRLDSVKVNIQRLQTDISYRVNNIVDTLRAARPVLMPLYVVRQGGAAEPRFLSMLVEDRTLAAMSYSEWWSSLARTLG